MNNRSNNSTTLDFKEFDEWEASEYQALVEEFGQKIADEIMNSTNETAVEYEIDEDVEDDDLDKSFE